MQIDFSAKIMDLHGKEMNGEDDKPITLAVISCNALLASYQDEQNLPGEEKVKRFRLAMSIADGGKKDWKLEDAALLKKLIGCGYPPLVVGRAFDIIEPPALTPKVRAA